MTIRNFGRNVAFDPQVVETPEDEARLLELLAQHRGRRIRTIGSLHSWSAAAVGCDVVFDLRHLDQVQVDTRDGQSHVTVGAGCRIARLVAELDRQGLALPSLGLIMRQTIAGAISTGTHGSGKHSLSHYPQVIRIATYDPVTGDPVIRQVDSGDALRAARCSLGAMGIIVSVGIDCRPQYRIEQRNGFRRTLDEVLELESEYPLQQIVLIPWLWRYMTQSRREVSGGPTRLASLHRLYWWLLIDVASHAVMQVIVKVLRSRSGVKGFYRRLVPLAIASSWRVVDRSDHILTMHHELFRHIEIEMFVRRSMLPAMARFVEELIRHCDGDPDALSEATRLFVRRLGCDVALRAAGGSYTHHYPIAIRKVLADDTLISMASSDDEAWYALSFISYAHPDRREGFLDFARLLSKISSSRFGARPHWGKHAELDPATLAESYPHLDQFRRIAMEFDPQGVFRNEWLDDAIFGDGSH